MGRLKLGVQFPFSKCNQCTTQADGKQVLTIDYGEINVTIKKVRTLKHWLQPLWECGLWLGFGPLILGLLYFDACESGGLSAINHTTTLEEKHIIKCGNLQIKEVMIGSKGYVYLFFIAFNVFKCLICLLLILKDCNRCIFITSSFLITLPETKSTSANSSKWPKIYVVFLWGLLYRTTK